MLNWSRINYLMKMGETSRDEDKKLHDKNKLNVGSQDGDREASSRYTEARLEKIVSDTMLDKLSKKGIIEMIPTYDGSNDEPTVLPVRFPSALINGVTGIAFGYATDIPSFNMREVIEASKHLLLNKDKISNEEFLNIVKGPDFPTGGVISDNKKIQEVTLTGKGAIPNRGDYVIEKGNKTSKIIFNSIPYGVTKIKVVEDLKMAIQDNEVAGLKSAEDESDYEGLRIVLEVDNRYDIKTILAYIFKNTSMEVNYNANMTYIHDGKPKVMGALDVIQVFNQFRVLTKTYELQYDKQKLEERLHLVEGFIKVVDIIDEVIKQIKLSKGKTDAAERLVKYFDFSERQSEAIVSMQLHRLSRTDKKALQDEKKEINKKVREINKLLKSDKLLREDIVRELDEISEEYGTSRKTKILKRAENWEVDEADLVEDETVCVSVSENGYVKRSSRRSYSTSSKNEINKGDKSYLECEASTKDVLFIFTNYGHYYRLPVYALKDVSWGNNAGQYLGSVGNMATDELVINAFLLNEDDAESTTKHVLTIKSDGLSKQTTIKNHIVSRYNNSYEAIKMEDGVKLLGAYLVEDSKGYLGVESTDGKGLCFPVSEITPKGLKVAGMRSINLKEGESVANVIFDTDEKNIPYKKGKRGQVGQKARK